MLGIGPGIPRRLHAGRSYSSIVWPIGRNRAFDPIPVMRRSLRRSSGTRTPDIKRAVSPRRRRELRGCGNGARPHGRSPTLHYHATQEVSLFKRRISKRRRARKASASTRRNSILRRRIKPGSRTITSISIMSSSGPPRAGCRTCGGVRGSAPTSCMDLA